MNLSLESENSQTTAQKSIVNSFLEDFRDFNLGLCQIHDSHELQGYLQAQGSQLIHSFLKADEYSFEEFDQNSPEHLIANYLFHFSYPDRLKSILILLRNSLLQLSIAELRHLEGFITEEEKTNHLEEVLDLLIQEFQKMEGFFSSEYESMNNREDMFKQKLDSIKHFSNPREIYRSQFGVLQKQLDEIAICGLQLKKTQEDFTKIRKLVLKMKDEVVLTNRFYQEKTNQCLEDLELLHQNQKEIDQVIASFSALLSAGKAQEINSDSNIRQLEDQINLLGEFNIPVESQEGYLLTRKIDFRKSTQKWMDYRILPEMIDLWDHQEAVSSQLLNVANRIKNSLSFAKGANSSPHVEGEILSWKEIIEQEKLTANQNEHPVYLIEELLEKEFKVSEIYKQTEYLKVPLQTNFARLRSSSKKKNIWTQTVGSLWARLGNKVKVVTQNTPHQKLEIALGILETRNEKEIPDHYHSLFQNKNFLGDLFMVRRPVQEEEIKKVVNLWKKGNNRSLAVIGPPMSGKSTLLEYAAHLFPAKEVLILQPNAHITVEGRKFKTSEDLGQALSFIGRSLNNSRQIVVLDDLHLWRNEEITLAENAASLIDFINTNYSKAFVILGITKSLCLHLDTLMNFSDGFTNLLEVKTAKFDEIYKAVMLRHGASHKRIFEKEGVWMTEVQIRKKIHWLAKKHDFNIGAVLQAWIFCTDIQPEGTIKFVEKETHLNDFLQTPELLILKYCLLFGYCTDLELKKLFTQNYEIKYKPAVRKLLNLHILERNAQGQLIVKNSVRQDLYAVLVYHELLAN